MQYLTLSVVLSSFYDVALYSAILPSAYLIMMLVGGMRRNLGLSIWGIILRTIIAWGLIVFFYCLCGQLFGYAFQDLGVFINSPIKGNLLIRYYPLGVFLVGMSGFWYPKADVFNINRTKVKRIVLCVICFVPFYLMIAYMFFVDRQFWGVCVKFGIRSSMLAFIISFPMIFFNLPNSLSLVFRYIVLFLFHVNKPTMNTTQS